MLKQLKTVLNKPTTPIFALFFLYLILFFRVTITNDDAVLMLEYQNLTWGDHWELIKDDYFNWSSRVLVNFVIHFLLGKPLIIFNFLNAVIAALFVKTFSKLFNQSRDVVVDWFIVFLILLYPIRYLGSAGWLVTMMTYFWPMVFGFLALVPIKKIHSGETFSRLEYLVYSAALLYSGNEELKLLVLLMLYAIYFVYFLVNKKLTRFFISQLFLLVASLIFTITTPGNGTRSLSEAVHWFPTYGMLDTVDKLDIGFFATMQSVIFEQHLFILLITILLAVSIFRTYDSMVIRLTGSLPAIILLVFGPLKQFDVLQSYHIQQLSAAVSENGLFTISTGGLFSLIKFLIVIGFSFSFAAAVMLCLESLYDNLFVLGLLISGVGSRVAMGFSPTIYSSGLRTATPLFFAIMAIGVMIFSELIHTKKLSQSEQKHLMLLMAILSTAVFILAVQLTHI